MLIQLHHQFKDGHTEMCAQREISSHDEMRAFVKEIKCKRPVPENAQLMACGENSPHFWKTSTDNPPEQSPESLEE